MSTSSEFENHVYTVEFRLSGPSLNLEHATEVLSVKPTSLRRAGSRIGSKTYRENAWIYNGYSDGRSVEWPDLETGLAFVLERMWPKRHLLERVDQSSRRCWWCGHFQRSFDGGPLLSASMLLRLGEFGANLYIDNYFSATERHPSISSETRLNQ